MIRTILHSDLNAFYASVETVLDPTLRGKAIAVCGSVDDRHGIVLAKSEPAKKAGVKTAMVAWEARRLCPGILLVPPHFQAYAHFSRLVREIYARYTDLIEPFGMDECWLDVTGSRVLAGSGLEIAERIRGQVREELGLTVSVGVSFNKVFAKLGSDLKKPDAVSLISEENFRDVVWPLPVGALLYCGPSCERRLNAFGIRTVGQLAQAPRAIPEKLLGKQGAALWLYANGLDSSRVKPLGWKKQPKSIGHGITCSEDLLDSGEVWPVLLELTQEVGRRLRTQGLEAGGVQLAVRNNALVTRQFQAPLACPTLSPLELARAARTLFERHYNWSLPVRSLTVTAISLVSTDRPRQLSFLEGNSTHARQGKIDSTVEQIRARFGADSILPAALLGGHKTGSRELMDMQMPDRMYV